MTRSFCLVLLFSAAACSTTVATVSAPPVDPVPKQEEPEVDTDLAPDLVAARPYESKVPAAWDGTSKLPLVLALHGRGDTGPSFARAMHLFDIVDEQNVLLAYPTGASVLGASGWSAMAPVQGVTAPDDVKYLRAVIADMASKHAVDRQRVIVVGLSLGGFMANFFACHASDKVAGIVSIAGSLVKEEQPKCESSRAVSVALVHGTADQTIPYAGGTLPLVDKPYSSATALYDFWSKKNGCGAGKSLPATDLDAAIQGSESTGKTSAECNDGTSVTLWTVKGGAHVMSLSTPAVSTLVSSLLAKPRG